MTEFDEEGGASERPESQQSERRNRLARMLPFLVALGRPVQLVRFITIFFWARKILTCYLDAILLYTLLGWLCGEDFWRRLCEFATSLFGFIQLMTYLTGSYFRYDSLNAITDFAANLHSIKYHLICLDYHVDALR